MKFDFVEESDYGQEILTLAAEVASLMDEGDEYSKNRVNTVLIRIKNMAANIQRNVARRDNLDYFEGGLE